MYLGKSHKTGLRYLLNERSELTLAYANILAISMMESTGFLEVSFFSFLIVGNVLHDFLSFL